MVLSCSPVSDPAHQINTVLLHLLVSVLQDGSQTGKQVFDRWGHLVHTCNEWVHKSLAIVMFPFLNAGI